MRIIAMLRDLKKDESGDWVVDFGKSPLVAYAESARDRRDVIRRIARDKGWSTLEVEEALDSGASVNVVGKFHATEYRYTH